MTDKDKRIVIGSDHAGFPVKEIIKSYLIAQGFEVNDYGTHSTESVDYPDFAHKVASDISSGKCERGVLVCGSGNGICMTANKHQNVRAALCWNAEIAQLARMHNDANILCLPGRYVNKEEAEKIMEVFLTTSFEGGRHQTRINKMNCN
jgi:ribose 5-phosphate isomerase B